MGCLQSSETKSDEKSDNNPKEKVYSWDKRGHINPNDYIISDLKNETIGRLPGKVDGQQFVIQNCEDCKIYIFDYSATVTVDDSSNCQIFIGPSKGSVYIRDCKDCKFVIACQQFRTRDCKRLDVFLCCNTQPIIESSSGMKFACFQYYYPELEEQFEAAGLSLYNNNWSRIHDFTPAAEENTWTLLPESARVEDYIPLPLPEDFSTMKVSLDNNSSVVPLTLGSRRKLSDESCLVVFYPGNEAKKTVKSFIKEIFSKVKYGDRWGDRRVICVFPLPSFSKSVVDSALKTSYRIVQTKEVQMTIEDAKRVFGDQYGREAVHQGAVIGLEINGDDSVKLCNDILDTILHGKNKCEHVFASTSKETSAKNIDDFYNFVDITMS